jgi:hypothetical protein
MMSKYQQLQKELASGWNTWDTFSIYSHVHLPEGFALRLIFKDGRRGNVLENGYIGHYELGKSTDLSLPGPRTYDGRYTEIELTWQDNKFLVQSATDGEDQLLLVTPIEPDGRHNTLAVEASFLWNRPGCSFRQGDALTGKTDKTEFQVWTTCEPVQDPYFRSRGPYLVCQADTPVGICTGSRRSLSEIQAHMKTRREEILQERNRYADLQELYEGMQSAVAWNTIYDPWKDRVISPVSRVWNNGWNGYVLFCWDTYFAGLMAGLDHKEIAYANVVEITREMTSRGFVPNFASTAHRGSSEDRSQPPVGARTLLALYRRWGDKWLVEEIFDQLLTWNRWWKDNRITGKWLGWGSNAFTDRGGNRHGATLKGAVLESGLDNSPMYDHATFDEAGEVMNMADAGLTGMYVMDCKSLAELAGAIGRTEEAGELTRRAEQFKAALNELWDQEAGIYRNRHTDSGELSEYLSPTNFYPLCGGAATPEQAGRMVQEHLLNEKEFWGDWVLPSISRKDAGFEDQKYWRGRVWGPMNQIVYWGLLEYDLPEARRKLAEASARLFLKEWRSDKHVHENYNSITGQGCDARSSNRFYHWGALLALIALDQAGYYPAREVPYA